MTAQQPQFSVNLCALSPAFNRVVCIDKAKRASEIAGGGVQIDERLRATYIPMERNLHIFFSRIIENFIF